MTMDPQATQDPLLKVEDLKHSFVDGGARVRALRGVSFEARCGQVTAIVGPSGCGKSTFLRSLNRMNDTVDGCQVKGEVLLDGDNIYQQSA